MHKITAFCKTHKNIIVALMFFALVVVVFFTAYKVSMVSATQKLYYDVVNYGVINETLPIENEQSIAANAVFDEDFAAVAFMINTNNATDGKLTVQIKTGDGTVVATGEKQIAEITTRDFTSFNLDNRIKSNTEYEIVVTAHLNEGQYVTLLTDDKGDSISLAGQYDVVGRAFTNYFIFFTLLSALISAGAYLMLKSSKVKMHTFTLIAILLLGVLYNIVLPVYSAPDEAMHINQTFNESTKMLNAEGANEIYHDVNYKRPSDNNEIVQDAYVSPLTYKEITNEFFTLTGDNAKDTVMYEQEEVGGYTLPYMLPAIFVSLARILHFGFVPTLFLARAANLVFYALAIYFAVKITPVGKSVFAVISLIPISLHVANSFSRDNFIISMAILLVAITLRLSKDLDVKLKYYIIFSILFMLFLPSKATYLPLLLIVLVIPLGKLAKQKKYTLMYGLPVTSIGYYIIINGAMLLGMFGTILSKLFLAVSNTSAQIQTGVSLTVDYIAMDSVRYSMYKIATNLPSVIVMVIRTFLENTQYYVYTLFGGSLGYFDINISWLFVIGFIILLLLAANNFTADEMILTAKQKVIFFVSSLLCCALVVLGCITWTPVHSTTIYGIQGRYFTPALAGIVLSIKFKFLHIAKDISKHIVFAAVILNVGVLMNAFYIISTR